MSQPVRIGRYQIIEELGRGAQSSAWLADAGDGPVLLKSLRIAAGDDDSPRARFYREIVGVACLERTGLVRLIDVGEWDDNPFYVVPFRPGKSLAQRLRAGPLSADEALGVFRAVAEGLDALHGAGFVHRDIKPANIIISEGGAAIIDFGLSAHVANVDESEAVGTPLYSAPEQLGVIQRPVQASADLYSLGVVLFEALTGRLPYASDTVEDLLAWHASGRNALPSALRPEVTALCDEVVDALLTRDPDDRAARAAAVARRVCGEAAPLQGLKDWYVRWKTPCFGRAAELARVQRHLGISAEGAPRGTARVVGEKGIGRSTFLNALEAQARAAGRHVLRLSPTHDDQPFASLSRALNRWLAPIVAGGGDELARTREWLLPAAGDFAPLLQRLSAPLEHILGATEASRALELTQDPIRFAEIIADFLANVAARAGGLVILADDVDGFDAGTARVLRATVALDAVAVVLSSTPSAPQNEPPKVSDGAFASALKVELGRLDPDGVRETLEHVVGVQRCSEDLADCVVGCVGSHPFAVRSYAKGLVDAGALALDGGRWSVRVDRAASVPLPRTAADALTARVDSVAVEVRRALGALALVVVPVDMEFFAEVIGLPSRDASALFAQGVRAGLAVVDGTGSLRLVHPDIAKRLRAEVERDAAQGLHARIADVVSRRMPDELFAEARHRLLALPSGDVDRAVHAALLAGRRALATYTNDVAYDLLDKALAYVDGTSVKASEYFDAFGQACTRTARIREALDAFDRALRASTSPPEAARIHMQVARVHMALWNPEGVQGACEAARAAVSDALPASVGGADLIARVDALRKAGVPPARWIPVAVLLGNTFALSGFMAWSSGNRARMAEPRAQLRRVCEILEGIGDGIELNAWLGYLDAVSDRSPESIARGERALALAREGTDRAVEANVQKFLGWSCHVVGLYARHEELQEDALRRFRRWLSARDFVAVCNDYGVALLARGQPDQAERVARLGFETADATGLPSAMANIHATLASALAMRGELVEASALLEQAMSIRAQRVPPRDVWTGTWIAQHRMFHLFEQNEQGAALDALLADARALALEPGDWPEQMASFFVLTAYLLGRRAERLRDEPSLDAFRRALDDVTTVCRGDPLRRTHERVLHAMLARIEGRPIDASGALDEADTIGADAPEQWARFEVLRERARGAESPAQRTKYAGAARDIARRAGWISRERWVLREFPSIDSVPPAAVLDPRASMPNPGRVTGQARMFDALLRVSLASQSTRDPAAQARAILDELLAAFGGERAFLFAIEGKGEIRLVVGRAGSGGDVSATRGFATTLVRRVAETGVAQVLAGTEEGAVLGSKSAVAHDLRSIMAAPVRTNEGLYGVVYVDSRVVKGLYHRSDLDVLVAMAGHIGAGIESARLARVEIAERELRKDLEVSAAVQKLFFPRSAQTSIGPWTVSGASRPATQCGGDWWGWEVRGDSVFVVLGDVTGHGAAPAILTASVASVVRMCLRQGANLSDTLLAVHDELRLRCAGEYQMQAAALELAPDGSLTLHSAGAPPPFSCDKDGVRPLVTRGAPLGGSDFACGVLRDQMSPEARLLLYSDGIIETMNESSRSFGTRRLARAFGEARVLPLDEVIGTIDEQVDVFRGATPDLDDRTMVLVVRH